jgi:hypothetical protein
MAHGQKKFVASARLSSQAFQADSLLAEDMKAQNRYDAACAAALAGAGKGDDQPPSDEPEKARWRKQALEWLRADLAHWTRQAATGKPDIKALVGQTLDHWKADADLAGIRDESVLRTLPEAEQKACRKLWAEVDQVLKQVKP